MNIKPDHFNILRKVHKNPNVSQRELSRELNLSLGKLNYCLKELKKKRIIKNKKLQKKS